MKTLGFSEEEQTTMTLLLSGKRSEVEEELRLLTQSHSSTERKQSELELEIDLIDSICEKLSQKKIIAGREVTLKIKALKFSGTVAINPAVHEGVIYCSQSLFDGDSLKFQVHGQTNIVEVEEFIIDQDAAVFIPIRLTIAGEEVVVNFNLCYIMESPEHSIIIGRDPLQGMLIDPSYPEEDYDDSGIFLYEGMG